MLMLVSDRRLDPNKAEWIVGKICEGVASKSPEAALATNPLQTDEAASEGRPTVLAVADDESAVRLEAAAASAAAVVWVTTSSGAGVRKRLRLDTGGRFTTKVTVVVVSDERPDPTDALLGGVNRVEWVVPVATKKTNGLLRRIGKSNAGAAAQPRRLDRLDKETIMWSAAHASMSRFEELLDEEGVEEFQIRGAEYMLVSFANGPVQQRHSPFSSDEELIETVRHLASFSGGMPQRFDRLDHRLDIRVGDRWRLHAEAFMCNPPTMVLRSNMGGSMALEDLGVADPALLSILVEAVAGSVRANIVVAAAMGGGKTTLCQALLAKVAGEERIDTIEDTPELRLAQYGIHGNTFERLTRDPSADGVGRVSMGEHIRDAKRANSAKLVIGETRGEGTLDVLDAMSSGLDGCLVTLHSRPGAGVQDKLLSYAYSEGAEPRYARQQIAVAVDLLLWMGLNNKGERVIADVTQIERYDPSADSIVTRPLWQLRAGDRWATPVEDPVGRVADVYRAAGVDTAGRSARRSG